MSHHAIWRTIRRPFRYPSCDVCRWEVYDVGEAGCLKCGARHTCSAGACPLETCDDASRVCTITGQVLREVRHAASEFTDTVSWTASGQPAFAEIDSEVQSVVYNLLAGEGAKRYRAMENSRQSKRLGASLYKVLKRFKMQGNEGYPCMCTCFAEVMSSEKNLRFVGRPTRWLVDQCCKQIVLCMLDLRSKGVKINTGPRIQNMACGLLYLLQTGLRYQNKVLLGSIEEIGECLPHENKLEQFFGISSKVICETENEIKLVFREHHQPP